MIVIVGIVGGARVRQLNFGQLRLGLYGILGLLRYFTKSNLVSFYYHQFVNKRQLSYFGRYKLFTTQIKLIRLVNHRQVGVILFFV